MQNKAFAVVALALAVSTTAHAQVSRVFVSVNGNDSNACANQATPCRTIAGGIAQVDADGEVFIIDSGSYAGGTITKAVKVTAAPGVVAFSALSFTISPGVNKVVVLRGLTIKALTPTTGIGINHLSGVLSVENCIVDGWLTGINTTSSVDNRISVSDSTFRNNMSEDRTDGFAINIQGGVGSISRSLIFRNSTGVRVLGGFVVISDSTVIQNTQVGLLRIAGLFGSTGNNVVEGNGTDTVGTIVAGSLK